MQKPEAREVWRVRSRNLRYAVYIDRVPDDPTDGRNWIGIREKGGSLFLDASEMRVDLLERVGRLEDDRIPLVLNLGSYDAYTGRLVDFDTPVRSGGRGWYYTDTGISDETIYPMGFDNRLLFWELEEYEDNAPNSR